MADYKLNLLRRAGVAAPLVYVGAVILGGAGQPGYSHMAEPISALTATGGFWLNALFGLYNLLLLAFSAFVVARPGGGNAGFRVTGWLMALLGFVGLALLAFPMDLPGAPATTPGAIHIGLAALASIASMGAITAGALGWRQAGARNAAMISWVALGFVIVTGGLAAFAAAAGWPVVGLLERLTIGGFLAWVLWSAFAWQGQASSDQNRDVF